MISPLLNLIPWGHVAYPCQGQRHIVAFWFLAKVLIGGTWPLGCHVVLYISFKLGLFCHPQDPSFLLTDTDFSVVWVFTIAVTCVTFLDYLSAALDDDDDDGSRVEEFAGFNWVWYVYFVHRHTILATVMDGCITLRSVWSFSALGRR